MTVTAFTAPELAYLRARPQVTPLYLAVHKPLEAYTATVQAVPTWPTDGTGAASLAITGGAAGDIDVSAGQVCRIGTDSRDWLRLRTNATGPLAVAATSQTALPISIGQAVTVLDDYRPVAKRIRYSTSGSAWNVDYDVAYSDQQLNIPPVAIMGCAAILYAAGSQTFNFDGTNSYGMGGATIAGYAWVFPDGTTSASGTPTWATADPYADGRWVTLTVTDSNGKTQTTRRLLWKFDAAHPPYTAMTVDDIDAEWGGGASVTVRVLGAATISDIPDGAHVALFTAQSFSGSAANIGGNFPNRQNVVLEGWIVEGSIRRNPYYGFVEFKVATADYLFSKQEAFPVSLTGTTGTPANWQEMQNITLDKVMTYLARYTSNALEIMDVYVTGKRTPTITAASSTVKKYADLAGGSGVSVWAQFADNYSWLVGGTVSCDAQGALWCEQDAQIAGNHSSLPVMLALTDADLRDELAIAQNYAKELAQVVYYAINFDTPIGSASPDWPPDYGAGDEKRESKIHATQAQLNTWSGNARAQGNNPYPTATLPMAGAYAIQPAPQSVITVTDANVTYPRPQGFSAKRFIVRKARLSFDPGRGSMLADLDCEPETDGADGVTVVLDTPADTPITRPPSAPPVGGVSVLSWHFNSDLEGWTADPAQEPIPAWVSTPHHNAAGSIKAIGGDPSPSGIWNDTAAVRVAVRAGTRLDVWVLGIAPLDLSIQYTDHTVDAAAFTATASWAKYSLSASAASYGKTIDYIFIYTSTSGTIYIDDVSLII